MTDIDRKARPASPCISVCTLDAYNRCQGCGRTLEQISKWARMTPEEQWAVVDALASRPGTGVEVSA